MSKVAVLLRKDARGIARDRFLLALSCYALLLALALRLLVPWIPIESLDLYVAPVAVTFGGTLAGMVFGFALIEERELQTFLLLRVVPLRPSTFFGTLSATSVGLALATGLLGAVIYGLPVADLSAFLAMTAASACTAPVVMLLLGAASTNKLEGMAFSKVVSSLGMVPALAFVLPGPWQILLAWNPFYWIYLGLLRAYAGEARLPELAIHWPGLPAWLLLVAPLALCLGASVGLARRYARSVR